VDEDLIRALAQKGCVAIQFGVESGNVEILRKARKGITLPQVESATALCLQWGIRAVCTFIIGFPDDTRETVQDTIGFAKRLKRAGAQVFLGLCTPYPGTEIFRRRADLGLVIENWDYSVWTTGNAVARTKHFTIQELDRLYREAVFELNAV
jgi:radical SAM superfamily enzyme YgiQ (UPF0313 family)